MFTEIAAKVEKRDAEPGAPAALSTHVLAVDDDPSIRNPIADYLGDNEMRITVLAGGREIAEVMQRETVDLVVLDWRLPG
jgi:DNA-binding response OmpR family regulator